MEETCLKSIQLARECSCFHLLPLVSKRVASIVNTKTQQVIGYMQVVNVQTELLKSGAEDGTSLLVWPGGTLW